MQEGSFRCDANVSVRRAGAGKLGTRCEIKNLNSFRFIEKAINYEVARQIEVIEAGGTIRQETRLYDPDKGETRALRSRKKRTTIYFPDPDLLPVALDARFIESVRTTLPELPDEKARATSRSSACRLRRRRPHREPRDGRLLRGRRCRAFPVTRSWQRTG